MGPARRILRTSVGVLLVIVGLAGLLLPIMPGLPFLLLGIAMIGIDHPILRPVRGLIARFRPKRP